MEVIYFDIGDTLAKAEFADDGKLVFHPLPGAIEALETLAAHRKGIISDPGEGQAAQDKAKAALQAAFGKYFSESALIHWGSKKSTALFEQAIKESGVKGDACLFVGENARERQCAKDAGMRTAATPQQAVQEVAAAPRPQPEQKREL
ncbi:HAD hydrolase-like protein [Massilia sp. BJB1822]|uniref:HAD hydrolase-like protein n=1 Tax=Massilia sp. BJB1822 TaxID=2744470 RepID=UPI001593C36B|nr:HAD hydrolase-like protein [Massilia sp. BJB1822]NVD97461.1 HAD hydrolase-like protein [Massilia sp. BJB1822]